MKLLVDTDVLCKLHAADLLGPTASLFGACLDQCGRLPAAPEMLKRGRLRRHWGSDESDAILATVQQMPVAPAAGVAWLDPLIQIDDIDAGEAQLFAAAAESELKVITGDKRALAALSALDDHAAALEGRLVAFEAILLALCNKLGVSTVRTRASAIMDKDKVVRSCFSPGNADPKDCLMSYFQHLANSVAPLILWDPVSGETS